MHADSVIHNARVVSGGRVIENGWVAIRGETIAAIGMGDDRPETNQLIDASGQYLIPGLVDCEHHPSHPIAEAALTETWAAAASGITTAGIIGTSPRMVPQERDINDPDDVPAWMDATVEFVELMKSRSSVDYFITPGLTKPAHFPEIPQLFAERGITSFKVYLHVMTGEHIWNMWGTHPKKRGDFYFDDGAIYSAMTAIAELGPPALLLMHTENWEIARVIKEKLLAEGRTDIAAYSEFSPDFVEAGHVRNYAYYARKTGCPLFIIHTTTPETLAEIRRAKADGVEVFANITPHYLILTPEYGSINVPLRPERFHETMWQALRSGEIDTISSDSLWRNTRSVEDVEKYGICSSRPSAWIDSYFNGSNGFMLPIMLSEGVNKGRISLKRLVEVSCENPAKIFGIYPRKGTIAVGADADLVLVDINRKETISRDMVLSRGLWSVWEGWETTGWPTMTMLRGNVIMKREESARIPERKADPLGQYLSRTPR